MNDKIRKPDHISQQDWDAVDSPPLTSEFLEKMKPAREAAPELIALQEEVQKRLGRPKAAVTKTPVMIRLDPKVVEYFKHGGGGWQTRINDVLRSFVTPEDVAAYVVAKRKPAKKASPQKAVAAKKAAAKKAAAKKAAAKKAAAKKIARKAARRAAARKPIRKRA